jgi:hypothetical protein
VIVVIHFLQSVSSYVLSLASWSAAAFGKGFYWQDVVCCFPLIFLLSLLQRNGRKVGLSELAKEWLTKAQIELKQTPTLAAVKELLTQVEQFLWAGHEMDPVCSFSSATGYVVSLVHHYNDGID